MSAGRTTWAWRALALYLVPALLLALTVLPTLIPNDRLPQWPRTGRVHPLGYTGFGVGLGALLAAAWATLWIVKAATPRDHRKQVWQLGLPILYAVGGYTAAWQNLVSAVNLDRHDAFTVVVPGLTGFGAIYAAVGAAGLTDTWRPSWSAINPRAWRIRRNSGHLACVAALLASCRHAWLPVAHSEVWCPSAVADLPGADGRSARHPHALRRVAVAVGMVAAAVGHAAARRPACHFDAKV